MTADARISRRLVCASAHDLLAPYEQSDRRRHEELCAVLRDHYGFVIGIDDFLGCADAEDPNLVFSFPLNCIEIGLLDHLLVVDCLYQMSSTMQSDTEGAVGFKIASDSVIFNLIEMLTEDAGNTPHGR